MSKSQFEFDTLLVYAWRKDWRTNAFLHLCRQHNIDPWAEDIDRRCLVEGFDGRTPIRAAVHGACESMSKHLWNCKASADFVKVRNALNRGYYTFKGRAQLVTNAQSWEALCKRREAATRAALHHMMVEDSKKPGGCGNKLKKRRGRAK